MRRPPLLILLTVFLSRLLSAQAAVQTSPPPPAPAVYLTFDDGPLNGSQDIVEAIRVEKVKITVLVVGHLALAIPRLKSYLQLYETNPWIEVGNHSFSHAHDDYRAYYANPKGVVQDFQKNEKALAIPTKVARLPGRNMWRLAGIKHDDVKSGSEAADLLFTGGYRVFGWDLEWQHDLKTGAPVQTVEDMLHLIELHAAKNRSVKPGHVVVLCHDEMFRKAWEETELKQLIEKLRAKSFRFAHLSEYP
jgi:peptidoglycan/xylan/chitin deacetylase (PgdA/CDA1 family)